MQEPAWAVLLWILGAGLLMSAIALIGVVTVVVRQFSVQRFLLPLVSLSAGTLIGGAFFHMIPAASIAARDLGSVLLWVLAGFSLFLLLEQVLHWHACRRGMQGASPMTYLILLGDGLHNLIGGFAVGGAFLLDIRLGITAWLAAAAHEIPQELGDFGVLVHGGWSRKRALQFNFLSALTFPIGGVLVWVAAFHMDTTLVVAFAAGNFLYIGASDLVPEINKAPELKPGLLHFLCFALGIALMYGIRE